MNNTIASIHEAHQLESQRTVEVFKTSVSDERMAARILEQLSTLWPHLKVNFDLEDCAKVLRVESRHGIIDVTQIMQVVKSSNHTIEILE